MIANEDLVVLDKLIEKKIGNRRWCSKCSKEQEVVREFDIALASNDVYIIEECPDCGEILDMYSVRADPERWRKALQKVLQKESQQSDEGG